MTTEKPKINELVRWLNEHDKETLDQLRIQYPLQKNELKLGIMMDGEKITKDEYLFRLDVGKKTLKSASNKADDKIEILKKRLKNINNVQLIGQLIVLVSGATILSIIQKDFGSYTWIKYIAPALVLIASILTIVAKNRSEALFSGKENLYEITSNMMGMTTEANLLLQEIDILLKYFHEENAKLSIASANNLAKKLNDYIKKTGI